ncbi:hypothetical protein GCM10027586_07780 [Kineococcus gypseus]
MTVLAGLAGLAVLVAACSSSTTGAAGEAVSASVPAEDCGTAMTMSYGAESGYGSAREAVEAFARWANAPETFAAVEGGPSEQDQHALAVAAAALAADPRPGPGSSLEALDERGAYVARALLLEHESGTVDIATFMYPSLRDGCDAIGPYRP